MAPQASRAFRAPGIGSRCQIEVVGMAARRSLLCLCAGKWDG